MAAMLPTLMADMILLVALIPLAEKFSSVASIQWAEKTMFQAEFALQAGLMVFGSLSPLQTSGVCLLEVSPSHSRFQFLSPRKAH